MKGIINELKKNRQDNVIGYEIKGDDGKIYFAHLGDLHENEHLLYELRDHKLMNLDTVYKHTLFDLKKGEKVDFHDRDEKMGKPHAFNVKRVK